MLGKDPCCLFFRWGLWYSTPWRENPFPGKFLFREVFYGNSHSDRRGAGSVSCGGTGGPGPALPLSLQCHRHGAFVRPVVRKSDALDSTFDVLFRQKGDFLLKNMAFFFIPAGVGILEHYDRLKANLLPFLAVCVLTTFITFFVSAMTVRAMMALQKKGGK